MSESPQNSPTADHSLLQGGAITLILGFLATVGGSIWTILSPIDGGVNFGAGLLYEGGILIGLLGTVLTAVGLIGLRRTRRKH